MRAMFKLFFFAQSCLAALGDQCDQDDSAASGGFDFFLQVALEKRERQCVTPEEMRQHFADLLMALETRSASSFKAAEACATLLACVDTTSRADQDAWAAAKAIEVAIFSLRAFDDKPIRLACASAVAPVILFNRENGLRAGALGGLNLTFAFYAAHMDDPLVTSLGGAIGAYFDLVDENRRIARELGGIQLLIQNMRNNFHGMYSSWAFEPVKQSLFGLSSGTWRNQDICAKEDIVPLHVQLILEHGSEPKIAEEALQAVKAMIYFSDLFRHKYAAEGLFKALAQLLLQRPRDRGAVSLACGSSASLIGRAVMTNPGMEPRVLSFDANLQKEATEAGLLNALILTATSRDSMQQIGHPFNFDVDLAYDVEGACYEALRCMATDNPKNRLAIQEKLPENIDEKWPSLTLPGKIGACNLLQGLNVRKPKDCEELMPLTDVSEGR